VLSQRHQRRVGEVGAAGQAQVFDIKTVLCQLLHSLVSQILKTHKIKHSAALPRKQTRTEQEWRLMDSKLGQLLAKHETALSLICRHPLAIKNFSFLQPSASASTPANNVCLLVFRDGSETTSVPLSVIWSHQEMLMWVIWWQPSAKSLSDRSVIVEHELRLSRCSFGQ
jgi:hypothetical protein